MAGVEATSPAPAAPASDALRDAFALALGLSKVLPEEERLIMYDACDGTTPTTQLTPGARKRLDARRNTKPKKPDDQRFVCTPFDESKFHFGKIRNESEKLLALDLHNARYTVLANKFPLFKGHMLLVAEALVPQQMTAQHLLAALEVVGSSGHCAYFNSWCASASINHFHCHLIDELPPVAQLPLVPGPIVLGARCLVPANYPGTCYVLEASRAAAVDELVRAMQADNQPHNLLLTPSYVYIWPKPHVRPAESFDLYPETVGGPELLGSFTVYTTEVYEQLQPAHADILARINTAPLPARCVLDEAAVSAIKFSKSSSFGNPGLGRSPTSWARPRDGVRPRAAAAWVGHRQRNAGGGV